MESCSTDTSGNPRDGLLPRSANSPWTFWRLLHDGITPADWARAGSEALACLEGLPVARRVDRPLDAIADILSEAQFGKDHWRMSRARSLYYLAVRPVLPVRLRRPLRSFVSRRQRREFPLGWPIEDRFVRFRFATLARVLALGGLASAPYLHFWPEGRPFAFVLTHDVEDGDGQRYVRATAALEERYGFRSSFNFVAEDYRVDLDLLEELRGRGFEIGVHGLKHDGRLFASREAFLDLAARINAYLARWDAVGFRSPFTHRQPEWMQALEIEYDSSFFDTDPFETTPGGTMSVWPFTIGHFVELPYTLAQDHTLMVTLGETTPRVWQEKVDFLARCNGLALVNVHPDLLATPRYAAIYEAFLGHMRDLREASDYWHALPRQVARWWRKRAGAAAEWDGQRWRVPAAPEATVGEIRRGGGPRPDADATAGLILIPDAGSRGSAGAVAEPGRGGGQQP